MKNMRLHSFESPEPTQLEIAWSLAPRFGGDVQRVLDLNYEEFLLAMATHDYLTTMEALTEQLSGLLSQPPMEGDDEKSRDAATEHADDLEEAQLLRIQEACCWALPVDHIHGEQLQTLPLRHWLRAPGMLDTKTGGRFTA